MVVQPIACFSVKEGLQTLYGKLPQLPTSKRGIYGLVLVVGSAALAALFLAHRWYTSRQKNEGSSPPLGTLVSLPSVVSESHLSLALDPDNASQPKQRFVPRPMMREDIAAISDPNEIFAWLNWFYEQNRLWLPFIRTPRGRSMVLRATNLYEHFKYEYDIVIAEDRSLNSLPEHMKKGLCNALSIEIQRLKSVEEDSVKRNIAQGALSRLIFLLRCEKIEKPKRVPPAITAPRKSSTIEDVLAELNKVYVKHEAWRIYTSGQAAEDSFYSYLAQLCKIKSVSDDSVKVILNAIADNDPNIKQCFCRVLQLEANSLNSLGDTEEGYADIPQATKLLSQLIKLLECET